MLFVLRQLRRLELHKRSGQYFLYAFGEIVLIVVGILIALQINEWKAEQELERQRLVLIENLKADFRTTLERADACIQISQPRLEDNSEMLRVMGEDLSGLSINDLKALGIRHVVNFQPVLGAYRSAVSTGALGLVEDSNLKQLFIEMEDQWIRYQNLRRMHQHEVYATTGSVFGISEMVGDSGVLDATSRDTVPPRFELSDEAFRQVYFSKEYYALKNVTYRINIAMLRRVTDIQAKAEEILARLEEL